MTIQKAAAAGVCAALIALQFKGGKTEYGIYVSIAAGLLLAAGISGETRHGTCDSQGDRLFLGRSKDLIWVYS